MSKSIYQKLNFRSSVYHQIIQKLSIIDSFKGNWKDIENQESRSLKELRKIATIESIGSSTCIDEATLNDEKVKKFLNSVKITKL